MAQAYSQVHLLTFVKFVCIRLWLRVYESKPLPALVRGFNPLL